VMPYAESFFTKKAFLRWSGSFSNFGKNFLKFTGFEFPFALQTQQFIFRYHRIRYAKDEHAALSSVWSVDDNPVTSHGLQSGAEVFAVLSEAEDSHGTSFGVDTPSVHSRLVGFKGSTCKVPLKR
jgi:hypothetical protein